MLTEHLNNNENIFISIACYRDTELIPTILSAYENADNRGKLYFGVYLQYHLEKDKFDFDSLPSDININVKRTSWENAKGPVYARYVINKYLFKNQKYYLQIDSHTRFSKGWDTYLKGELNSLEDYSILSTYPPGYKIGEEIIERSRSNIMKFKKLSHGIPIFRTDQVIISKPERNYFWAAGFSFSKSIVFKKVMFDRNLKNLFMGEEFLMSLRFYANNIKIYTPTRNVIYTLWDRNYRPTFWEIKNRSKLEFNFRKILSYARLLRICNLYNPKLHEEKYAIDLEKYKIADQRIIDQYLELINVKKLIDEFNYEKQYRKYYFSLNND